jgi:hypothetical protein
MNCAEEACSLANVRMTSSFTWLDGSDRQRRQMRDLLSQFREQGTRDELGIGTIRDAFADLLFPGTGALQTRARYFFFVPWMYQDLERKKVPASEVERRARRAEIALIDVLATSDEDGTIGVRARRNLQRLPSSVYWTGLRRLGFFEADRSQDDYHRNFDAFAERRVLRSEDGEIVSAGRRSWHSKLPSQPSSFPEEAAFALTKDEAGFLTDRIRLSAGDSFFTWWLDNGSSVDTSEFAWQAVSDKNLPSTLLRQVRHAHHFSEVMLGAALLYNLLLTRLLKQAQQSDDLAGRFDKWHDSLFARATDLRDWSIDDFWRCCAEAGARIGQKTRDFVAGWVKLAVSDASSATLRESVAARSLIERREKDLKRGLARFTNARALELWGGSSGLNQIDYRWSKAVAICRDINAAGGQ